jgi:hypothetical protein
MRSSSTCGIVAAVLVAALACGGEPTSLPRKLTGVWIARLPGAAPADTVRIVVTQYSDYLEGNATFAATPAARYRLVGSFIGTDVQLDLYKVAGLSQGPQILFRGTYANGHISGQLTGSRSDGSIALVPWRPNVAGIVGTWVFGTLNGARAESAAPGVHDTLVFRDDGQLTRARYTPTVSYEIPGLYERRGSSVIVQYTSPFLDWTIPQRDSLVLRNGALVRVTPTVEGSWEESYQRVP